MHPRKEVAHPELTAAISKRVTNEELAKVLSGIADINAVFCNEGRHSPLHFAVIHLNIRAVKLLLDKKADPNKKIDSSETVLHVVAQGATLKNRVHSNGDDSGRMYYLHYKDRCVVRSLYVSKVNSEAKKYIEKENKAYGNILPLLLEAKANVSLPGYEKTTALHYASLNGYKRIVEQLLSARALPNVTNDKNETPLHLAAMNGHNSITNQLLAAKASVDKTSQEGYTPLSRAIYYSHIRTVQSLIDAKANANIRDEKGFSALHCSVGKGDDFFSFKKKRLEITSILIKAKADVNLKSGWIYGEAPVDSALSIDNVNAVRLLLDAKVELTSKQKLSLFFLVYQHAQHHDLLEMLLQKKGFFGEKDKYGSTALAAVVSFADESLLEKLLAAGASLQDVGKEKHLLVFSAVEKNFSLSTIDKLCKDMSLSELKNTKGESLLVHAIKSNADITIIERLLFIGNSPHTKRDKEHKLPLIVAIECGHVLAAELIMSLGLQLYNLGELMSAATLAVLCRNRPFAIFEKLAAAGISLDTQLYHSGSGDTPLIAAVGYYNASVARRLIQLGANPYAVNKDQKTALDVAEEKKNHNISRLLKNYKITPFLLGFLSPSSSGVPAGVRRPLLKPESCLSKVVTRSLFDRQVLRVIISSSVPSNDSAIAKPK